VQVVHKYDLQIVDEQEIEMPIASDILSVGMQGQNHVLWARVDPASRMVKRKIYLVGTGGKVPEGLMYINTTMMHSQQIILHWFRVSV
jgi:hypothetical protein